MIVEVEMRAFGKGQIRKVTIPSEESEGTDSELLERVFHYGQNDFQPQRIPSVSVGDVVRLRGKRWYTDNIGFKEVVDGFRPPHCPRCFAKAEDSICNTCQYEYP